MMLVASWITGMSVGIEFFTGDDLEEGDKFAMVLNLAIVRLTLVVFDSEE